MKSASESSHGKIDYIFLARIYDGLRLFLLHKALPQDIIFPELDFNLIKNFHEKSPIGSYFNKLLKSYLSQTDGRHLGDVLEIGSGTGSSLCYLDDFRENISSLTLSDYSKRLLRELKKSKNIEVWSTKTNTHLTQIDLDNLPVKDGERFDFIFSINTFHLAKNIRKSCDDLLRMTRVGGTVILGEAFISQSQPNFLLNLSFGLLPSLYHNDSCDIPLKDPRTWKDFLIQTGFKSVAIYPENEEREPRFGGLIIAQK